MTAREHGNISRAEVLRANTLVTLFERCDAFRKPQRFGQMLQAAECDSRGRGGAADDFRTRPWPQGPYLLAALAAARAVNAGEVAAGCGENKARIPLAVHGARVSAVKALLREPDDTPA
jgi:tRNA nucleotidyltransferase (CCA-adding enzyme)